MQQKFQRIQELDFLRGIAILVMLVFHSSYYWDSTMTSTEMNNWLNNPLAIFALFIGKFAGIFAVISGAANAISISARVENKKNKIGGIIYSSFVSGLWIIVLGRIHTSMFNHTIKGDLVTPYPDGPEQYSLIVGSIQTGELQLPSEFILIFKNTALFVIGMSVMCSGVFLALLSRKNNHQKLKRNLIIIGSVATIVILVTEPLKIWLRPIWVSYALNHQYVKGFLLGFLIGDTYPFFPYAGFAFYGMIFGIAYYHQIDRRKVAKIGGTVGGIYLISGIILLIILGHPDITEVFQTLSIQWNLSQIGSMILIMTLVYWIHFNTKMTKVQRIFRSRFVRRFGLQTLTVFFLEPIVGTSIKVYILDKIFPGWSIHLSLAFVYGISLIFLWFLILRGWEEIDFIGSLEWITAKVISWLTFREPTRLKIKENLYLEAK
ncbi:MAG: heparan-alpha-glucosaminide N-acetyltransferase domain-containing protein [Candidatus Heimdallarchaeaceae archaeon]